MRSACRQHAAQSARGSSPMLSSPLLPVLPTPAAAPPPAPQPGTCRRRTGSRSQPAAAAAPPGVPPHLPGEAAHARRGSCQPAVQRRCGPAGARLRSRRGSARTYVRERDLLSRLDVAQRQDHGCRGARHGRREGTAWEAAGSALARQVCCQKPHGPHRMVQVGAESTLEAGPDAGMGDGGRAGRAGCQGCSQGFWPGGTVRHASPPPSSSSSRLNASALGSQLWLKQLRQARRGGRIDAGHVDAASLPAHTPKSVLKACSC